MDSYKKDVLDKIDNLRRFIYNNEIEEAISSCDNLYVMAKKYFEQAHHIIEVLGRQNQELLNSASRDYMTGAYNRNFFMLKFDEEFSIANEYGKSLSCLLFDIDRFKRINDTYGHIIGDFIIESAVIRTREVIGEQGLIGRFGGDEFMILLPNIDIKTAEILGDKLIKDISNHYFEKDNQKIRVTISMGITDNKIRVPEDVEVMIKNADHALYEAKESGRNKYVIAY